MKNNQQEDEKDAAAGTNTGTEKFNIIQVICLIHLVLTTRINSLTGAAERLGPLQITPTNLRRQKPHLHVHHRQTRSGVN